MHPAVGTVRGEVGDDARDLERMGANPRVVFQRMQPEPVQLECSHISSWPRRR